MRRVLLLATTATALDYCGGEYSICPDGSCALVATDCGRCDAGAYACPLSTTCLASLDDYESCPGLDGTSARPASREATGEASTRSVARRYLDWTLDDETRVAWLLANATTAEMIAQLVNDAPAIDRLSLPAYDYLNDNEHGVKGVAKATVYPMGISLGASFSKETARAVGAGIGLESRSTHNVLSNKSGDDCSSTSAGQVVANGCGLTLYAPNVDVPERRPLGFASDVVQRREKSSVVVLGTQGRVSQVNLVRDPRWGRAEEVYGEDPHLSAEVSVGVVTGMQLGPAGGDGTSRWLAAAGVKHYAVYNNEDVPEERTKLDANVSSRDLWETYLPVFKALITRANASHVMCSYNAVNGKPTCAHPELLNDILRDAWGFEGFVVSDYDAWKNLVDTHHYVDDYEAAAAVGINSGMDQEGGFGSYAAPRRRGSGVPGHHRRPPRRRARARGRSKNSAGTIRSKRCPTRSRPAPWLRRRWRRRSRA